jgi:hypothetical protein
MDSNTNAQGGSGNNPGSTEPLEPGRPDVMPGRQPGQPGKEGEIPLDPADEAPIEEDMGDVDVNNSVSPEHPE